MEKKKNQQQKSCWGVGVFKDGEKAEMLTQRVNRDGEGGRRRHSGGRGG